MTNNFIQNKRKIKIILGIVLATSALFVLAAFVLQKNSPSQEKIIYPEAKLIINSSSPGNSPSKTTFKSYESPQFTLNLGKKTEEKPLTRSPFKQVFAQSEPEIIAEIFYGNEPMNDQVKTEIQRNGGDEYNITLPQPNAFRPGKYTLSIKVKEDGAYQNITQDFDWGVLAINTNKSIYQEYEEAKIYFGVLDEKGHTVCDAKLRLQILNPKSETLNLSTEEGTINSSECAGDNFTYIPDYFTNYKVGGEGIYQLKLTAETKNGEYQIRDSFQVAKEVPFEIERIGPTRINPAYPYDFKIKIKANQDFEGEVIESLPDSYQILNTEYKTQNNDQNEELLVWQVNWKAGKTYELDYTFDAPDISPEFYLLGPLRLADTHSGQALFEEARQWQVASDAITVTSLGTNQNKDTADPWTAFSSITLANGDSVILCISSDPSGLPTVTWNSQSLTRDVFAGQGNVDANIFSLHNVTGATGDVVIDWPLGQNPDAQAATLYKASGLASSNTLDKTNNNTGSSTSANSGATATLSQADELIIGAVGGEDEIDDMDGVWTTGADYVSGNEQKDGTNGAGDASNINLYSAAEVVSATTAQTAEVTQMDDINWGAVIATYKAPAAGINVSGRVCSSEPCNDSNGSAACSTSNVVGLSVDGGTPTYTDCNTTTGDFSFSGVTGSSTLTLFLNDVSQDATLVMKTSTSTIDDADFYDSKIVVRAETGTIGTTEMAYYDSDNQSGDIRFQAVVNTSVVVESGSELHVWMGDTFDPGGTVTTNTTGGVFHIDDSATAYLDTSGSNIGNNIEIDSGATLNIDTNTIAQGNITIDGSLTKSTGSPTLTLRGTNNISGSGGTKSFYILAVGDATQTSATTISSSITVTGGALTTYGASTIATSGTPNVNISAGTGNIGGGSGSISFYDLTIGGTQTLESNITVSNNLSVSSSLALNDKNINVTNGDFATTSSGQITCSGCTAGTATLSGTSKNIGGGGTVEVYNLILSGSYSLQTATTVKNDLTVNGTMSGSSDATINGAFTGTGTVNMSGGTVEQRVGDNKNFGGTGGNAWTFSTLLFSNSSESSDYTVTTQSDSGGITASSLLQIGKSGDGYNTTLNAANRTWTLQGTDGTPFNIIGSSSLTASTSTFSYEGANAGGDTTVQDATYNNLTINASDTFVPEASPLDVNTDLTITTGILAMGSNNLTINDDLTVTDTLTISGNLGVGSSGVSNSGDISVGGTLTQSSSGTTTVKTSASGNATIGGAGTLTFYNLTLAPDVNGATLYLGSGGSQSMTVSNDLTIGNGTNTVTVNADNNDPDLDINGSFSISANGTFQASSDGNFQIAKDFTNNNSFVHNSGTITFDSANDSTLLYSGATTFNNFYVSTGGKQMKFDNVDQTNVAGLLTLQGTDCTTNRIFLDPDTPSQTWEINATGGTNIDYVDVEYSNAITTITADNSTQVNNNNTNWNFTDSACGIGLSGTAYSDEGGSPLGDNLTVNLRIDGGGIYSDETASGVWEIGGLSLSSGQIVTVYLDDETPEATTVMVSDGTDQNNVHLYQNTVIVRADTGSISNANMATGDDTDDDVKYSVSSNNLLVVSGFELHVWTGDTYDPNGTVTTQGGADFHVDDSATAYLDTATSTIADDIAVDDSAALYINDDTIVAGGAINAAGTVTTSAGTPTTTIRSTGNIGGGGSITFHNLTIGDATTASTTLTSTVSTNADVSIGDGSSLELSSQSLTVGGGDITTSGAGTITCASCSGGTTTVNGSGTGIGGGSGGITFYNLTIGGTIPIVSAITVSNDLTANGTMSGSSNVTVKGAIGGTGTINMSGGTVEQRVGDNKNFGGTGGNAWTFSTLLFSNSSESSDYTVTTQSDSGGITASSLLQIGKSGDGYNTTLNAANRTWTLQGTDGTPFNIIGSSSLTASTSTFSYEGANAGGDTTVQDATYNNLTINASDTFVPEASPLNVNGDLTVTTGTLSLGSNSLNVGSSGVSNSGDISVGGNLTQSASGTTTVQSSDSGAANIGGAGSTTFYNLDIGPSSPDDITYTFTTAGDISVSGNLTIQDAGSSDDHKLEVNSNDNAVTVSGLVTIDDNATYSASSNISNPLTIGDDFTNNGTFTHNSGEVVFNTTNTATLNGSGTPAITFYNLTSTTAGKTLEFTAAKTFRIDTGGLLTLTNITVNSTSGTQWLIDHQGTENVTYCTIQNSGCAAGTTTISLDNTNTNGGNNGTCWDFEGGEAAIQTRIKGGIKIKGGVRIK